MRYIAPMWKNALLWLNAPFAWGIFLTVSLLNVVVGLLFQLVAVPFDVNRRASLWVNRWIWGHFLWSCEPGWHLAREGFESVSDGPYIVVCNHSSVLDIPACMGLPLPLRVVGRSALFRIPLLGLYMRFSRQISLDATSAADVLASLEQCKGALESGASVLIFPEGTRSLDAQLGRFHRGAFRLALDTGIPILPVAILGTHRIMRKGKLRPAGISEAVRMRVLAPVLPEDATTARALGERVRGQLESALSDLREQAA